jgi:hypothetical protein
MQELQPGGRDFKVGGQGLAHRFVGPAFGGRLLDPDAEGNGTEDLQAFDLGTSLDLD